MSRKKTSRPEGTESAVIPANPAVDLMAAMFAPDNFVVPKGTQINSLSPMIKPIDFPVGRRLVGKFSKIFRTKPSDDKDGAGIEITPEGMPVGIAMAATTLIANALKIKVEKGQEPTSEYLGRYIMIEKLEKKIPSKRGNDAWNFIVGILPPDFTMQTLPAEAST